MIKKAMLLIELLVIISCIFYLSYINKDFNSRSYSGESKEKLFYGETVNLFNYLGDESFNINTDEKYPIKTVYLNNDVLVTCGEYDSYKSNAYNFYCVRNNISNNEYLFNKFPLKNYQSLENILIKDEDEIYIILSKSILIMDINLTIVKEVAFDFTIGETFKIENGLAIFLTNKTMEFYDVNLNKINEINYQIDDNLKNSNEYLYFPNKQLCIVERNVAGYYLYLSCFDENGININERKITFENQWTVAFLKLQPTKENDIVLFYTKQHEFKKFNHKYSYTDLNIIKLNGNTLETIFEKSTPQIGYYNNINYGTIINDIEINTSNEYIISIKFSSSNSYTTNGTRIWGYWRDALILFKIDYEGNYLGSKIFESNVFEDTKYEYNFSDGSLYVNGNDIYINGSYIKKTSIDNKDKPYNNLYFLNLKTDGKWNDNFIKLDNNLMVINHFLFTLICGFVAILLINGFIVISTLDKKDDNEVENNIYN